MRKLLAVTVVLGAAVLTAAQERPDVLPRYGVSPAVEAYGQATPKEALDSAIKAAEKGKADYLAAHLIEPRFIDARVAERAAQLETAVDQELRAVRIAQRANPVALSRAERLPDEAGPFAEVVRAEANRRAFRLVARDIAATLTENPDHVRDLKRFLRAGAFVDAGDTSSASLPDLKDRSVFFRKLDGRWFIEDRKVPEATPPTPPPPKN